MSPQNGDTRGGPPPYPPLATPLQIIVFITIKRRPTFSIIKYSFNFCSSLKAKSILEVSKIYKGSLAYSLALNADIIEVFVLAKQAFLAISLSHKTRFQSQHYHLLKTIGGQVNAKR